MVTYAVLQPVGMNDVRVSGCSRDCEKAAQDDSLARDDACLAGEELDHLADRPAAIKRGADS
jgi:hypothetical protein